MTPPYVRLARGGDGMATVLLVTEHGMSVLTVEEARELADELTDAAGEIAQ